MDDGKRLGAEDALREIIAAFKRVIHLALQPGAGSSPAMIRACAEGSEVIVAWESPVDPRIQAMLGDPPNSERQSGT